jgi:hypothetical protein
MIQGLGHRAVYGRNFPDIGQGVEQVEAETKKRLEVYKMSMAWTV